MAALLGYANVDTMLSEMTASQWQEWQAYGEDEPYDDREARADYRAYVISGILTGGLGVKGVNLNSLFPTLKANAVTEGQTEEDMKKIIEHIVRSAP